MSKYIEYGHYYDSRTEQEIMLIERIENSDFWIAEPSSEEEPYIIVFERELKDIY